MAAPLNGSVHVIKYFIIYSINGTKKVQTECNKACLNCRVKPFLSKDARNKIEEIKVEGLPALA